MDSDVIIIGAGLCGLYAGVLLKESGINVTVLEGRSRISGRQWTYRNDDIGHADMGGAYIGNTQTKVLEVLYWLGLKTYSVYVGADDQKSSLTLKSGRQLYSSGIPYFKNPLIMLDLNNILRKLDHLSKQVPINNPWDAPQAEYWDSLSVQDFIDQNMYTQEAKALAKVAVITPFVVNPEEMSFLYLLHEIRLLGGLVAITTVKGGLQEFKIIGGSSQISDRLADKLQGQIYLNEFVTHINEVQNGIEVLTESGSKYSGKKAIVCTPLPAIGSIKFEPRLPYYIEKV